MIRRPPRSTLDRSSAASDVYKRQVLRSVSTFWSSIDNKYFLSFELRKIEFFAIHIFHLEGVNVLFRNCKHGNQENEQIHVMKFIRCLLYTSDAADERSSVDLGGRRIFTKKKKEKNYTTYT